MKRRSFITRVFAGALAVVGHRFIPSDEGALGAVEALRATEGPLATITPLAGGTFRLVNGAGVETCEIAFSATAAEIQAALDRVPLLPRA